MEIRTVRKPGDKGTQALMKQYGERLVCIRYRYDPARKKRYKTVELIVTEEDWQPPEPHPQEDKPSGLNPRGYYTRRLGKTHRRRRRHVGPNRKAVVSAGRRSPPAGHGAAGSEMVKVPTYSTHRVRVLYVGTGYYWVLDTNMSNCS